MDTRARALSHSPGGGGKWHILCLPLVVALTAAPSYAGRTIDEANEQFRSRPNVMVVDGRTMRWWKQFDVRTNTVKIVSDTKGAGGQSWLDSLERESMKEVAGKYGAMLPEFHRSLLSAEPSDTVDLWVSLRTLARSYFDKSAMTRKQLEDMVRESAQKPIYDVAVVEPSEFAKRRRLVARANDGMLLEPGAAQTGLRCRVRIADARALAFDPDVASVEPWVEPTGRLSNGPSHYTLVTSAFNPSMTYRGVPGIHCATIEDGVGTPFLSCIGVTRTPTIQNCRSACQGHSETCFALMHWTSPGSTAMHSSVGMPKETVVQQFLTGNQVNSASCSVLLNTSAPEEDNNFAIDQFAFRAPYTTWSTATGNDRSHQCWDQNGQCLVPMWPAYNAICAGNVRDSNLSTYVLSGCTQTRNPLPPMAYQAGGAGSVRDHELPCVVVPGYQPTGSVDDPSSFMDDPCLDSSNCGTSWSAPILNGICANLMSANQAYQYWPEAIRACVLATARDVDGQPWDMWVDGADGAGVVCGADAEWFIRNHSSVSPDGPAVEHAMRTSSWQQTDNATKRFNIRVPASKPAGRNLRIVLTWDANPNPTVPLARTLLTDLGLYLWVGSDWYFCDSYWGNTEIIEVPDSALVAGATYQVMVTHSTNRLPSTPQKLTYWSIAWTWVKQSANGQ